MKILIKYFLQGLMLIAPIGLSLYIIYAIFMFIEELMSKTMANLFDVDIPGVGLVTFILVVVFIGIIGQTFIARPFRFFFHQIIEKTPFLKVIYASLNDLFSAFIGKEKKFNKPVLVQVDANLERMGFLTEENLSSLGREDKVAVYFPHSYNFTGEMYVVDKSQVNHVNIGPAEAMKFIVSGGVSGVI